MDKEVEELKNDNAEIRAEKASCEGSGEGSGETRMGQQIAQM